MVLGFIRLRCKSLFGCGRADVGARLLPVVAAIGASLWWPLVGCDNYQQEAIGNDDEILVVTDSLEWDGLRDPLAMVFERAVITPQDEAAFYLSWIAPGRFPQLTGWKNLLIVSTLDRRSETAEFIRAILSKDALEVVERGEEFVFTKTDYMATGQILMVLTAPDTAALIRRLREEKDFLYEQFDTVVKSRIQRKMYLRDEQKKLSSGFRRAYRWSLRIPAHYTVVRDMPEDRFVWLGREDPIRWISVYWEEHATPPEISAEWAIERRAVVGDKLYGDVLLEREHLAVTREVIGEWYAYKITGLYSVKDQALGGPFRSWVFYDGTTERVYVIDTTVFAPDRRKVPHLLQLEVIARSFETFPFPALEGG